MYSLTSLSLRHCKVSQILTFILSCGNVSECSSANNCLQFEQMLHVPTNNGCDAFRS